MSEKKVSWADIADEEDLSIPVVINKDTGKIYIPPSKRPADKTKPPVNTKK
jgi:hypothetical protein